MTDKTTFTNQTEIENEQEQLAEEIRLTEEDTGTESNTEKEKGLASDSFKRACFNWGIGRELYTAPFIWVGAEWANIADGKCYDKFEVEKIETVDGKITKISIINSKTKTRVFVQK